MTNSHGNTNRDIRKFLRETGVKANVANVERIGREVRRTEAQNEQAEKFAKERGDQLSDERGPVEQRIRERVQRELRERGRD